eukprot:scaffold3827_cov179-Cylindrotheca_fusiformis.AAC.43
MKMSLLQWIGILVVLTAIQSFLTPLKPEGGGDAYSIIDPFLEATPTAIQPLKEESHKNRTMIFVHVGKTGGETIKWRLRVICNLRGSQRKKAKCFEQFQAQGESKLSQSTIGYTHCGSQRPKHSMEKANTFLVSIRDPIVSKVREECQLVDAPRKKYMHPQNCIPERPSGACNLKKDTSIPWGHDFFEICFQTVDAFVQSMQSSTTTSSTNCSQLAIDAVQGNGPKAQSNHLYYNYMYNFNRTIRAFPHRAIVVVRRETLWEDMRSIEILLGGDGSRKFEHEGPVITHGSEKFLYQAVLDPSLIPTMCCAIPGEILVYFHVLSRAVNLDPQQKEYSRALLLSKCQANSVEALVTQCRWNKDSLPTALVPTMP